VAIADAFDEVLQRAHSARGDHRHRYCISHGTGERDVEPLLGAVSIHGGQQDFAGAERGDLARVIDSIEPGRMAPAMGEDFPTLRLTPFDTAWHRSRRTMHWSPNFSAASFTNSRRATAAVLIDTLSAPHVRSLRMSSTVRTPAADGERHEASLGRASHHARMMSRFS